MRACRFPVARLVGPIFASLATLTVAAPALAADLILNGGTITLGGVQTYGTVSLTNGATIIVRPFNATDRINTGNLVLKADSITIDATSKIVAKGAGYQAPLCGNGTGPAAFLLSGGRGGCGVRDSGGGGAHFGGGGRGTKDCPGTGCVFPQQYEEDCLGAVNGSVCASTTDCRDSDALPTVAGQPFVHTIYATEFGAAGGDKGCRDGDGFAPSGGTSVAVTGGGGGGRIVLFAANDAQTGALNIQGVVNANGNRGCASGNDSAGGGAGGTVLLIGDSVAIGSTARILASGGRGGDSQPKCLACTLNTDCSSGQTCVGGRCSPCNCTPCTSNAQCNAALGQACTSLGGAFGNVCADASNQCTPVDYTYEETECKGTQMSGTCDDCGGGGGGGIVNVLSRIASISPIARFDVRGNTGGVCPICTGEAGGSNGELQIDGAYVGEVCDGYDNDFNGTVDDGLSPLDCNGTVLPSCVGGIPQQCPANAPSCIGPVTDTRPRFVVIIDSSGSMLNDPTGYPTFGDGSVGHSGVDTASDTDTVDGNNARLYIAKQALNNVLAAFPHADYALARYHQDASVNRSCQAASWFECQNLCCSYDDPRNNTTPAYPIPPACNLNAQYAAAGYPAALNTNISVGWPTQDDCINYAGACGAPRRGADVLVGFSKPLEQQLMWLDGKETNFNGSVLPGDHCAFASGGDCELRATGPTPLAGSLDAVADYLTPIIHCDGGMPCRKYGVILLTDGVESCQGNPTASATALRTAVAGVAIDTYVVGFSVLPSEQAQLNAIAAAGGTGAAYFANNEGGLSNALASIIASSTNFEECNDLDDNCNGLVDEDFTDKGQVCDDGGKGVCRGTGARVCNASGSGTTCQITSPGQAPGAEVCNGLDDNCNGLIDEGGVCQQCVPMVEVCNGLDDNCNAAVDDNPVDAGKPCGLSVGECSQGITSCMSGKLTCEGSVGPQSETCNGLDDDCNGVVDGMKLPCYAGAAGTEGVGLCRAGTQLCTAVAGTGMPAWGACVGEVKPSAELCDGLDNDCNGLVDDAVSDGLGHMTGEACCRSGTKCGTGECTVGVYACAGSQVVCDGGQTPSGEQCDGLDNDCNGLIDDVPGKGAACAMPGGCPGVFECQVGAGMVCVASASGLEICNGVDDDCDGSVDEEPDVSQNDASVGIACDAPQAPKDKPPCKAGTTICKAGVVTCSGAVNSSAEICNGSDDDCDGTADQPNPCAGMLVCKNGACLSRCKTGEFPCPGGEVCVDQVCMLADKDAGSDGNDGDTADTGDATSDGSAGGGAGGASDGGVEAGSGGSAAYSGGGGAAHDNNAYGLATGGGGCACSVPSNRGRDSAPAAAGLLVAALALGRRRSRSQAPGQAQREGAK